MDLKKKVKYHFLCSICLEVFTDPVTTPCGHNFCESCISKHWDTSVDYKCPICNHMFTPGEVLCDVCTGTKHSKPLEVFCKSDQTCVCLMCSVMEHKSHQLVPLREGCEEKKVELEKIEADLQQMIQKRREKLEEIRESVRIRKDAADRVIAEGVEMFTALIELVQRGLKELMEKMEEQQEAEEREAEGLIKELEEEISELMKRSSEVEQLSHSEDHLHLLQHFYDDDDGGEEGDVQFAVDVTLDPLTAHPNLVLSDDGKQVKHSDVKKKVPDNPERISCYFFVLGKQSFSSGTFYFEVQVEGKTTWVLGVASESINRKRNISVSPQDGYWALRLINRNEYLACEDPRVILHLKCVPEKVGVFVDYEEGVVSFYDVDAAALIYSFTHCCFTHKLHPLFSPCLNDADSNQ
uniref:Uncharacterized protein n=1 Tax=Gouania willdenowi TaxID=441366 RepID=A0A8C5G0R3_GOUWI